MILLAIVILVALLVTIVIPSVLLVWVIGIGVVVATEIWSEQGHHDTRSAEESLTLRHNIHLRRAVPDDNPGVEHTDRCCRNSFGCGHLGSRNRLHVPDGSSHRHNGLLEDDLT